MIRRSTLGVLLAAAALSCAGGGDAAIDSRAFVDVRVVYVSKLPEGCPDIGNICYPGCAHSNAPAGLQAVVPLWGAETLRLAEAGPRRYEGVLTSVPTNTALRLFGRDLGMCCVDACNYGPVLDEISLNGTKLTKLVRDGLPPGVTAALEFSVSRTGTIRQ